MASVQRSLAFLTLAALLLPALHIARAADVYANSLADYSVADLYRPEAALGEPDGTYAEFWNEQVSLKLDMGEGEEGEGNLTLYINPMSVGARVRVTFMDAGSTVLDEFEDYLPQTTGPWETTYEGTASYRYVLIESLVDKDWSLDAVAAASLAVTEEPTEEPPVVEPEEPEEPAITGGDLVKIDGNSSVYLIGDDGKRHAFPNETTFFSWDYSFEDVMTIASDDLTAYTLGGNVTIKPGTHLVKLQTNPKVYAVAPDAELRWVVSEEVAIDIYGADWASQVVDVSDAFWTNYTVGENIDEESDTEGWEIPENRY